APAPRSASARLRSGIAPAARQRHSSRLVVASPPDNRPPATNEAGGIYEPAAVNLEVTVLQQRQLLLPGRLLIPAVAPHREGHLVRWLPALGSERLHLGHIASRVRA